MSIEALREAVARLSQSVNVLGALGTAVDAQVRGGALPAEIKTQLDGVLDVLGLRETVSSLSAAELRPVLNEIRFAFLHNAKALSQAPRELGWMYTEREILQSTGELSAAFPHLLKKMFVPQLSGLAERLDQPGAAFLDIGVGVAALSIEMARLWPSLRIVGMDPWAPSLAIAEENIRKAGLTDRFELRQERAEELRIPGADDATFDLVWLPTPFICKAVLATVLPRVLGALRPGGWLLFAMFNAQGDPMDAAIARLRTVQWGGDVMSCSEAEALVNQHGFRNAKTLPSPPNSSAIFIVGQRPPA